MKEKIEIMKNRKGFIAALDQSGGSSAKTLELYGIGNDKYKNDQEMFEKIHEMRSRIITSESFTSEKIIGAILFEDTINKKIDEKLTSEYLWDNKKILSFLKIDKGLDKEENGVQLMKPIPNLVKTLEKANSLGIFGTKMRSVIKNANEIGISEVVEQQFILAKTIYNKGLIPIIEPEVDINSKDKEECEKILKEKINKELEKLPNEMKVIFKFTIPSVDNFYNSYINNPKVLKVVALSGGYEKTDACKKLSKNKGMIASFSRALLEGLNVNDTKKSFDKKLKDTINEIYEASIK